MKGVIIYGKHSKEFKWCSHSKALIALYSMSLVNNEIKNKILDVFPKISNDHELVDLLNTILRISTRTNRPDVKTIPYISLKQLKFYKDITLSKDRRYKVFTIKKKSGALRTIQAPVIVLKVIQQSLNAIFQTYYAPNDNACGFIPYRNIVDGAKLHTNKAFVYNVDLKDFFYSITFGRVKAILALSPFNMNGKRENLADTIANLCCNPQTYKYIDDLGIEHTETRNSLPQGAPTSPILTNIICRKLDSHLAGLARRFRAQYSRYADDITFSCHKNIFKDGSPFQKELLRIIEDEQGFRLNADKTNLQTSHQRQSVTGIIVNQKVNVSKRYVKQIRLWLHYWEIFGYKRAQAYFIQQYIKSRGNVKKHNARIENVIGGKLDYMRMVVGVSNASYKKMCERYKKLMYKLHTGNINASSENKNQTNNTENGVNTVDESGFITSLLEKIINSINQ